MAISSFTRHKGRHQKPKVNLSQERKMILRRFFVLLLFLIFKNVSHAHF